MKRFLLVICFVFLIKFNIEINAEEVSYTPKSEYSITAEESIQVTFNPNNENNREVVINLTVDKSKVVYYEEMSVTVDEASLVFSQVGKHDKVIGVENVTTIEDWMKGTGSDTLQLKVDLSDLSAGEWNATLNFKVRYARIDGLYDKDGVLLDRQDEIESKYGLDLQRNAINKGAGYNTNTNVDEYLGHSLGYIVNKYYPNSETFVLSEDTKTFGKFALSTKTLKYILLHDNVESFSDSLFTGSTALLELDIPDKVTKISVGCFTNCSNLVTVTYPETITRIENFAFGFCGKLKNFNIPKACTYLGGNLFWQCGSLEKIDIPEGVTRIPHACFCFCGSLKYVTMSDNVTHIDGESAFNSTAIEYIDLSDNLIDIGVRTFGSCGRLKSIVIPDTIQFIKNEVFGGCSSLESVVFELPEDMSKYKLTKIGNRAFAHCDKLTDIDLPSTIKSIEHSSFYNCYSLPDINLEDIDLVSLGYEVFRNCRSLEGATLPDTVETVGYGAFQGCTSLEYCNIPSKLTKIEKLTFCGCGNLSSLDIDSNITSIGDSAFKYCKSLPDFNFGNSLTSIGAYAFYNCKGIKELDFPSSLESLGAYSFAHCGINTPIVVPDKVTQIPDFAFYSCYDAPSIDIGDNVVSIGNSAFSQVWGLRSFDIPDSVTSIGSSAFQNTGILSIEIPNGVSILESSTFQNCWQLGSVDLPDNLNSIGASCFYGTAITTLDIPNTVVAIGGSCFRNSKLVSIIIPDSVSSFGNFCFDSNLDLVNVKLPNNAGFTKISVGMFSNCTKLNNLVIPNNVTMIDFDAFNNAFSGATSTSADLNNLRTITIPDSITYIGNHAFANTNLLKDVKLPSNLEYLGDRAFWDCTYIAYSDGILDIPDSLSSIGDYTFTGCDTIVTVNLPDTVTSLGDYAFSMYNDELEERPEVNGVESINLHSGITHIGEGCFENTVWLDNMRASDDDGVIIVNDILLDAQSLSDDSITSYTIPDNIREISGLAFYGCSNLSTITIPASVTEIGGLAFEGTKWLENKRNRDYYITVNRILLDTGKPFDNSYKTLHVGNTGADKIAPKAFYKDTNIEGVNGSNNLTTIGNKAFYGCTKLNNVSLSNTSLVSIGDSAFENCRRVGDLKLHNNLQSVGYRAFFDAFVIFNENDSSTYKSRVWVDSRYDEVTGIYIEGYNTYVHFAYTLPINTFYDDLSFAHSVAGMNYLLNSDVVNEAGRFYK